MKLLLTISITALVAGVPATAVGVLSSQSDPAWLMICSGNVRPVSKKIKSQNNGKSVRINDSIELCTKHSYEFVGKAGQRITTRLTGSEQVWMILSPKRGDRVFSETKEWEGALPTNGKYILTVVTAKNMAAYTLEIKIQ